MTTTETIPETKRNKGGRPKGSASTKSKSERLFDRLMNSRGDNLTRIVDKVMELAEAGDTGMIKAVLDRTLPARGRTVKLNLGGDPAKAVDRVIAAMDAGEITACRGKGRAGRAEGTCRNGRGRGRGEAPGGPGT